MLTESYPNQFSQKVQFLSYFNQGFLIKKIHSNYCATNRRIYLFCLNTVAFFKQGNVLILSYANAEVFTGFCAADFSNFSFDEFTGAVFHLHKNGAAIR